MEDMVLGIALTIFTILMENVLNLSFNSNSVI